MGEDDFYPRIGFAQLNNLSLVERVCEALFSGEVEHNDKLSIARELDVKFEGSAGTVVEQEWIEFHEKFNVQEPIEKHELEDRLWLFEYPIEGHEYIM